MEAPSQVILRNLTSLADGPVLLVDPPRDDLAVRLSRNANEVRVSTQDRGSYRWQQSCGLPARFEATPCVEGAEATVILFLPREKERLAMALHALAAGMAPPARLWLVGENRAGIKSAGPLLAARFASVASRDKARHCGLYEASGPLAAPPFDLADYAAEWAVSYSGRAVRLLSLPGVFAHGRLDAGSALLLRTLEGLSLSGRVLDFACGSGVLGLALKSANPAIELSLSDNSGLALEAARRSSALNGFEARLLASDGLDEVNGRYDWIVSNPPFHRGIASDLDVASGFFARAGTFLNGNGRIVIVFNRHLPYESWLKEHFGEVEILVREGEYVVIQAGGRRFSNPNSR